MVNESSDIMDRIRSQMERYHSGDVSVKSSAIEEIFNDHAALISFCLDKYYPTYKEKYFEDLYSAGKVGLLNALRSYDPDKSKPSTFFSMYIRHEMYEFVAKFIYNVTTYHANDVFKVIKVISEYENRTGHEPSKQEIAVLANMSMKEVDKALTFRQYGDYTYIDSEETFDELVDEYNASPEDIVVEKTEAERLTKALDGLSTEEREVIVRKYGLFDYQIQTNAEITGETGIPTDKIRKHSQSAIKKIKSSLEGNKLYKAQKSTTYKEIEQHDISLSPELIAADQVNDLIDEGETVIKDIDL